MRRSRVQVPANGTPELFIAWAVAGNETWAGRLVRALHSAAQNPRAAAAITGSPRTLAANGEAWAELQGRLLDAVRSGRQYLRAKAGGQGPTVQQQDGRLLFAESVARLRFPLAFFDRARSAFSSAVEDIRSYAADFGAMAWQLDLDEAGLQQFLDSRKKAPSPPMDWYQRWAAALRTSPDDVAEFWWFLRGRQATYSEALCLADGDEGELRRSAAILETIIPVVERLRSGEDQPLSLAEDTAVETTTTHSVSRTNTHPQAQRWAVAPAEKRAVPLVFAGRGPRSTLGTSERGDRGEQAVFRLLQGRWRDLISVAPRTAAARFAEILSYLEFEASGGVEAEVRRLAECPNPKDVEGTAFGFLVWPALTALGSRLGFDLFGVNESGDLELVEVKTTATERDSRFSLSAHEYQTALREGPRYTIARVSLAERPPTVVFLRNVEGLVGDGRMILKPASFDVILALDAESDEGEPASEAAATR